MGETAETGFFCEAVLAAALSLPAEPLLPGAGLGRPPLPSETAPLYRVRLETALLKFKCTLCSWLRCGLPGLGPALAGLGQEDRDRSEPAAESASYIPGWQLPRAFSDFIGAIHLGCCWHKGFYTSATVALSVDAVFCDIMPTVDAFLWNSLSLSVFG